MIYVLDTANIESIKKCCDLFPVSGVTTNPTIITKEKRKLWEVLQDIRNTLGNDSMLHVQTIGTTAEEIIKEAEFLRKKISGNLYVKIPVIPEGIKAIKILHMAGIKTTATAIFTPQQALMAAVAGASFVAPYVNRLDNICGDGIGVLEEVIKLLKQYHLNTMVLAASFKSVEQVHRASLCRVDAVTISPETLEQLLEHPLTASSIELFKNNWEQLYGTGNLTNDVD